MVEIIEEKWGLVIKYGHNLEERVRDLRKLNTDFPEHPKFYDQMCKINDQKIEQVKTLVEMSDEIIMRNEGKLWSNYDTNLYDEISAGIRTTIEEINDLTIRLYPWMCHEEGCGYCV